MTASVEVSGKGILNIQESRQKFSLTRYSPSQDLDWFIQWFWIVKWDLRGQAPYEQVVLSHPNVNMVFEQRNTRIYGITRTSDIRIVKDEGKVLGIKFRPGGFYPFWKRDISGLTGRSVSFREAFGTDVRPLEADILAQDNERDMVLLAERFFRGRLPVKDDNVEYVHGIVTTISGDRDITKVDDLVRRFGINKRTLQRLFSRYVGISPKWVIQRYRLHDAAEQLERGEITDWPKLSLDLGYYDQAHFIKDFKAIVGRSPEEYVKGTKLE
ncbi:AraC family transcriptional regulator [Paenibacillus mesophilus]|uniref:helix-turn-helix domain-containing protein n=1 Tax=Paenibacillus mesophilus TaxID=2582849 RepID=UPI00110E585E|nr:helix-turn-helix domain-containing protein [Paenibacillus mesophilus]TMV48934.1 AraC family transcriptional regulator [Paenibacillus mesophilus]